MAFVIDCERKHAMRLVLYLSEQSEATYCSELCRAMDLPYMTVYRTLRDLNKHGLIDASPTTSVHTKDAYGLTEKGRSIAMHIQAIKRLEEDE